MTTPLRPITLAAIAALSLALAACSSGADAPHHDHSGHQHGAAMPEQHHGPEAGGAAMGGMTHESASHAVRMKKIAPSAAYPLSTCVVSGERLGGDMGEAIAYEVEGQEVQFCCEGCVDEFKESPAKFLAKVREAGGRK